MSHKILVTADLHLGRKSSNVPGNLDESSAQFTWFRMVDWAVKNQVGAVVLAGDVIDRDNRFFEAAGPIRQCLEKLDEVGIPVLITAGNHDFDVLPEMLENNPYDHVYLLGKNGRWEIQIVETKNGPLQFLGWSFPQQHVRRDPLHQISSAKLNLDPNLPTIGILHGELNDSDSRYAPIALNNLINKEVDGWVLGHIHKPEIHFNANPLVLYTGSPQALSPKEPGKHGPYLLTVEDNHSVECEHILLSSIRYENLNVDVSEVRGESEFRNFVVKSLSDDVEEKMIELQHVFRIVYDIVLTGRHSLKSKFNSWIQNIKDFEREYKSETTASIRKVSNEIKPKVKNLKELANQPGPAGILAQAILDIQAGRSSEFLDTLSGKFEKQLNKANTSRTYQPLQQDGRQYSNSSDNADEILLKECEQLLANLLSQKGQI